MVDIGLCMQVGKDDLGQLDEWIAKAWDLNRMQFLLITDDLTWDDLEDYDVNIGLIHNDKAVTPYQQGLSWCVENEIPRFWFVEDSGLSKWKVESSY